MSKPIEVLYLLQLSMSDGKQLFCSRDGQATIFCTAIKYFKSLNTPVNITLLWPKNLDINREDENIFFSMVEKAIGADGAQNIKIQLESIDSTLSPIHNRYLVPMDWERILRTHYDLIWNNVPEISRNILALQAPEKRGKLLSAHWFPDYFFKGALTGAWKDGIKFDYSWRQLDGALSSDMNLFICQETLDGFIQSIEETFNGGSAAKINSSLSCDFLNTTDMQEYVRIGDQLRTQSNVCIELLGYDGPKSIFPSRITESLYTNWHKCFEMFLTGGAVGTVIFCNPSGAKGIQAIPKVIKSTFTTTEHTIKLAGSDVPVIVYNDNIIVCRDGISKEQYFELSTLCNYVQNYYFDEFYGGIAIREMVAIGKCVPFTPYVHAFRKWFNNTMSRHDEGRIERLPLESDSVAQLVEKFNDFNNMIRTSPRIGNCIIKNVIEQEDYRMHIPDFKEMLTKIGVLK